MGGHLKASAISIDSVLETPAEGDALSLAAYHNLWEGERAGT